MAIRLQRCQDERWPQFAERPRCIDSREASSLRKRRLIFIASFLTALRLKQKREELSAVEVSLNTVQPEAQRLAAEEVRVGGTCGHVETLRTCTFIPP